MSRGCPRSYRHPRSKCNSSLAELDKVEIRQEFTDIVLELDDGCLLHVEFQTTKESRLHRFLSYDASLSEKFGRKLRTVILYSGDVDTAPELLDIGSAKYQNVFLNRLDGDAALDVVERHLNSDEWTKRDRVRLAFAFHMRFTHLSANKACDRVLEPSQRISDPSRSI